MRRAAVAAGVLLLSVSSSAQQTPQCTPQGAVKRMPELAEASGVAVSRAHPGRLWVLNDSGRPELVAIDENGVMRGRLRVAGATVVDWEALAIGPCPGGSCFYIGDIGDNNGRRRSITIYRVPEPDDPSTPTDVRDAFHATYPDGPRDAETLLVTRTSEVFIVSKGEAGPVATYRLPRDARPGATVVLERVDQPTEARTAPANRVTDGAVSPNGAWVALRTNRDLRFFRASDLLAGRRSEEARIDLRGLREPQGEGVAFASDGTLYLVGEGGGQAQPGTLARLNCRM